MRGGSCERGRRSKTRLTDRRRLNRIGQKAHCHPKRDLQTCGQIPSESCRNQNEAQTADMTYARNMPSAVAAWCEMPRTRFTQTKMESWRFIRVTIWFHASLLISPRIGIVESSTITRLSFSWRRCQLRGLETPTIEQAWIRSFQPRASSSRSLFSDNARQFPFLVISFNDSRPLSFLTQF
jgi:hypothetical protein